VELVKILVPPSYTLDIAGNINFTGTLTKSGTAFRESQWITSGSNIYYNTGVVAVNNTALTEGITISQNSVYASGTNSANSITIASKNAGSVFLQTNLVNRLTISTISGAGNVGIGNTAPIGPLCIGNSAIANNDGFLVLEKCTTVGTTRQFRLGINSAFDFVIGDYGGNNVASTWIEQFKVSYVAPANSLVINSSGNVGLVGSLTCSNMYYTGNLYKNGALQTIPTTLNQLSGTVPYSSITNPPAPADMFKSTFTQLVYRESTIYYNLGLQSYVSTNFDVGTNLIYNEYGRPQLQYRWDIKASVAEANSDSQYYFFADVFYNQYTGTFTYTIRKSSGTWVLSYWWNGSGNNFLRINIRTQTFVNYLNVNIG
jgi:hypothetical protein